MSDNTVYGSIEGACNGSSPLDNEEYKETFIVKLLTGGNPLGRIIYSILHILDGILTILMFGLAYSRIWNVVFMWGLRKAIEIQEGRTK